MVEEKNAVTTCLRRQTNVGFATPLNAMLWRKKEETEEVAYGYGEMEMAA